jgi:hypothetical protein
MSDYEIFFNGKINYRFCIFGSPFKISGFTPSRDIRQLQSKSYLRLLSDEATPITYGVDKK